MTDHPQLAVLTPTPTLRPATRSQPLAARHPLRILVAEDHPVNLRVALRILTRLGYEPDVAGNGCEVLVALERQSYDIVLMDIQMPEMDGIEAARQIRDRIPTARRPRLIAVTAHAIDVYHEECVAAGMVDYIKKPIQIETLISVLERCRPLSADSPRQESPLDEEYLQAHFGADREAMLAIVVPHFLRDAPGLLLQLRGALRGQEWPRLRWAAHALGGSARSIGALSLARLCLGLEQEIAARRLDCAAVQVAEIEQAFDRIRTFWSEQPK